MATLVGSIPEERSRISELGREKHGDDGCHRVRQDGAIIRPTVDEDPETVILFRPVGPTELELIRASGWTRFPPRLPEQPIFYPVVQEEYARKIARDWNVRDSGVGYVTRFRVRADFLSQFEEQEAGGRDHTEYWIPACRLEEFNDALVGAIETIAAYGA